MDGMFSTPRLQEKPSSGAVPATTINNSNGAGGNLANSDCHLPAAGDALNDTIGSVTSGAGQDHRGESPDDLEKEERRRAAHKVLGKQG